MSIYVQIDIHGPIERVWELTQTPDLHQRWDLRFTEIDYLPRPDPDKPRQFLYATRIGFGLKIHGQGESVGSHDGPGGARTSALKFWSEDGKSLIRDGSGYWKYIPPADGGGAGRPVRFLTGYDYRVRFGWMGRCFDRTVFRPLIGWATAWSFDRLRLWIEKGIDPAASMRNSLLNLTARLSLAMVWLYQGLVPKLIFRDPGELAMLRAAGLANSTARAACLATGCAEVAIGLTLVLAWRSRWPLGLTLALMPLAAVGVAVSSPRLLAAPFNPVTLNLAVFALAGISWLGMRDFALGRALRTPTRTGEAVSSIYQDVLGSDFARLHPQIQKRFGLSSGDRIAAIGRGIMDRVWHGKAYTLPFLYVGTWRRIMFPEYGEYVPFTIENYAYRDSFGRETVAWLRTFRTRKVRRFDAYMIHSRQRRKIVDYLGTHQHLAVDIDISVDGRGGLRLRSGEQRFHEGPIAFRFPMFFSGVADVCEWYDDTEQKFKIEVEVTNPYWGKLFGYRGWFDVEWVAMTADEVPSHAKPRREERRE